MGFTSMFNLTSAMINNLLWIAYTWKKKSSVDDYMNTHKQCFHCKNSEAVSMFPLYDTFCHFFLPACGAKLSHDDY